MSGLREFKEVFLSTSAIVGGILIPLAIFILVIHVTDESAPLQQKIIETCRYACNGIIKSDQLVNECFTDCMNNSLSYEINKNTQRVIASEC